MCPQLDSLHCRDPSFPPTRQLLVKLKSVASSCSKVSYFVDACFKHTQTDRNSIFMVPIVSDSTISMSVHRWPKGDSVRNLDEDPW